MKAIFLINYLTLVALCATALAGERWRKLELLPAQLEDTSKSEEASVLTSAKKYFVNRAEGLKAVKVKSVSEDAKTRRITIVISPEDLVRFSKFMANSVGQYVAFVADNTILEVAFVSTPGISDTVEIDVPDAGDRAKVIAKLKAE